MALLIREDDARALLTISEAVQALEEAFRRWAVGKGGLLPRRRLRLGSGYLHVMGGADEEAEAVGLKVYPTLGGPLHFLILLYHARTGSLLALVEGDYLSVLRTGAATGLATQYLARPDASVVGIIGTGFQAGAQLEAVCAVRPVREVRAFSRTPEKREAFARRMTEALGVPVRAVGSAEECVRGADILITITTSREPVFRGEWLGEGVHINACGSNHWLRREVDEETVRRSSLIAVDDLAQAREECGELLWAVERGLLRWEQVRELRDIVAGVVPGRRSEGDITLFESQGLGLEDVAVAAEVYRRARERGLGVEVPLWAEGSP